MFTLHGSPKYILAWLSEYVDAKCLNTSSSGVKLGEERAKKLIVVLLDPFFLFHEKTNNLLFFFCEIKYCTVGQKN